MIHIDNVNVEALKKNKYKIKRILATGVVIMSMVPFLTGCGHKDMITHNPTPGGDTPYTYFTEEKREKDYIRLSGDITDSNLEELEEFGENIKIVYINRAFYIEDLTLLAEYCPNIEEIHLNYSPSISDLSFIYSLKNLKKVDIKENGYITPELVDYLDKQGIEHNITEQDLMNAEELDKVISEIITEDMTDEEKIKAITIYIIENYKYQKSLVDESNSNPLSSFLENDSGVCAGYAYVTNILLRKAGITSYEIGSDTLFSPHAWNLIELDGKYYYLDTTNIDQPLMPSKFLLEHFGIGYGYLTDPGKTGLTPMRDYDSRKISIPQELIEDIERGESEKTIIEKYQNNIPVKIIELILIGTAVTIGFKLASNGIDAVKDSISDKKRRKEAERLRRERETRRNSRRRPSYY